MVMIAEGLDDCTEAEFQLGFGEYLGERMTCAQAPRMRDSGQGVRLR